MTGEKRTVTLVVSSECMIPLTELAANASISKSSGVV